MYLYHGTSSAAVPTIFEHGIMPRTLSGVAPNSEQYMFQGHPDCVYMANGYASFHAAEAVKSANGFRGEAAILEIDTDLLKKRFLLPDDFVLAYDMSRKPENAGVPIDDLIFCARALMPCYAAEWTTSLYNMGTCAYWDVIPPYAIRRVSYVDFDSMEIYMLDTILDISVSAQAYLAVGKKYRMLDAWFMGAEVVPGFGLVPPGQLCISDEYMAAFQAMWQDRSMLRLENNPAYMKRR